LALVKKPGPRGEEEKRGEMDEGEEEMKRRKH